MNDIKQDVDTISVAMLDEMLEHTVPCLYRRTVTANQCGKAATLQFKFACCDARKFICGGCLRVALTSPIVCGSCLSCHDSMYDAIYDLGPL